MSIIFKDIYGSKMQLSGEFNEDSNKWIELIDFYNKNTLIRIVDGRYSDIVRFIERIVFENTGRSVISFWIDSGYHLIFIVGKMTKNQKIKLLHKITNSL